MQPFVEVQCPECRHGSRIEFRRLGSEMVCPGCRTMTVPDVPVGGSYPVTQWDLKFRDFVMLVRGGSYREHIEPLLSSWFGYRVTGIGENSQIVDSMNRPVDMLTVHLEIQDDSDRQRSLYQTAMSLWR